MMAQKRTLGLGHYERRFIDVRLKPRLQHDTGRIVSEVISKERHGDFLGGTIQVIHILPMRNRTPDCHIAVFRLDLTVKIKPL